jgi:hypothetical protein
MGGGTAYDGFALGGRIMTDGYSPVAAPTATLHPTVPVAYVGDGTSALFTGVSAFDCFIREYVVVRGSAIADGHYADGEIATAYRPDGRVVYTNGAGPPFFGTGDWPKLIANAATANLAHGPRILWAIADIDEPAYRADVARRTGGVVDYFDATSATPTAGLMASYDCVYTRSNFPYADKTLFGNRLADYVDAGGKVILGVFTTYSDPWYLDGRIMTPGYCPVTSPGRANHFSTSPYAVDGTTRFHHRVTAYDCMYRDVLVTQGAGQVDGHFADGEIAVAYRPDRRVVYVNGSAGGLSGTGDWAQVMANIALAHDDGGVLYGCTSPGELVKIDVEDGSAHWAANLPGFGATGASEIVFDSNSGTAWVQGFDGAYTFTPFNIVDGSATGPTLPSTEAYYGMQFALGRLYAAGIGGFCAPSDWGTVDTGTGALTPLGTTGVGPLVGLAFEERSSALYGLIGSDIDCGSGNSQVVRVEVTGGAATVLGTTSFMGDCLAFGPDGDLYGAGSPVDGGNLYRINPTTGVSSLIGPTGYPSLTGLMYLPLHTVSAETPLANRLEFSPPLPNPSGRGAVQFRFTLTTGGDARITLYDVAGRRVWDKALPGLGAGRHTAVWDGNTTLGRRAAAGVYYATLQAPVGSKTVKLVRLD